MLFKFLKNVIFIFCNYLSAWMVLNSEFCFPLQQLKLDELNKKGKFSFTGNQWFTTKKIIIVKYATYAVARRKPEKLSLAGIRTLTYVLPVQRFTNWASKPTGRWSLNWFITYPGKIKVKLWFSFILFLLATQ